MKNYKKNFEILKKNHVYSEEMEHDACGVGLIASTEGKKSRKVVEYGIEALKAVWPVSYTHLTLPTKRIV